MPARHDRPHQLRMPRGNPAQDKKRPAHLMTGGSSRSSRQPVLATTRELKPSQSDGAMTLEKASTWK